MKPFSKFTATAGAGDAPVSRKEFIQVINWIVVIFAYAWWAVIIVYYGFLDGSISIGYQLHSLPIVVVSLALVQILKIALDKNQHLLTVMLFLGLFVSGLLA
jgi:hypothetical protein